MQFKKKSLVMFVAAALSAGTAYAATLSEPTDKVVGFKPTFTADGSAAVSGSFTAGGKIRIDADQLGYDDADGDVAATPIYEWFVGGALQGETSNEFTIPKDAVGKPVTVKITPTSQTGDPDKGDPLELTNLATLLGGDDGNGNVGIDKEAKPLVSNLRMTGTLNVGQALNATYTFNANGGNADDKSTYAWGQMTTTAGAANAADASSVTSSGVVPEYTVVLSDAGSVLELSVQAKNNLDVTGNTVTVDTKGGVTNNISDIIGGGDEGNVEDNSGSEVTGGDGGDTDGTVPYVPNDPDSVTISFDSSATVALNGVQGSRPVANKDEMTADFKPAAGASPAAEQYTFKWMVDGVVIENAGPTYTPTSQDQGKSISVSVEAKQ